MQDLTGQHFGEWEVLYRVDNKGREVMWHCRCSCGTEKDVNAKSLKKGTSTSCGCNKQNNTNIVGKEFGHLLVISQDKNVCHCVCKNCGKEIDYTVRDLVNGRHKSCGCLLHKDEDLTGQRFGRLVAIKKIIGSNVKAGYLCRCDCGNEKFYVTYKLRSGLAKSCGLCYGFKGEDLTGQKFGHWTVESFSHKTDDGRYYWNCVCDCEEHTRRKVQVKLLKRGLSKSCGCDDISHSGSTEENEIRDYILELNPNLQLDLHNREILDGKEIDIYIPELRLGIEYNGTIYHATINGLYDNKDKNYHRDKFILAKEKGVRLLTVFDVD